MLVGMVRQLPTSSSLRARARQSCGSSSVEARSARQQGCSLIVVDGNLRNITNVLALLEYELSSFIVLQWVIAPITLATLANQKDNEGSTYFNLMLRNLTDFPARIISGDLENTITAYTRQLCTNILTLVHLPLLGMKRSYRIAKTIKKHTPGFEP